MLLGEKNGSAERKYIRTLPSLFQASTHIAPEQSFCRADRAINIELVQELQHIEVSRLVSGNCMQNVDNSKLGAMVYSFAINHLEVSFKNTTPAEEYVPCFFLLGGW